MRFVTSSCLAGALALLGSGAWAQSVISAHSGLVHYVEGRVLLADKEIDPKFGQFPEIRPNEILKTEDGRAEVLLSPGVFLRVAENSSIRMISNELTNTRVEVLTGTALVQSDIEAMKDDPVTLQVKGDSIQILKNGLYEAFADPARLRVYQGEAAVESANGKVNVGKGREVTLAATLDEHKFDTSDTDDLYSWTARRSGYIAAANVSSAQTMSSNSGYGGFGYGGFGYGGFGYSGFGYPGYGAFGYPGFGLGYGGWAYNPLFGMFTYVPTYGMYMDPFGYPFFSPYTVGYVLPYYYSGGTVAGAGSRVPGTPRTGAGSFRSPYALASARTVARSASFAARSAPSSSGEGLGRSGGLSGARGMAVSTSSSVGSMGGHASGGGHR